MSALPAPIKDEYLARLPGRRAMREKIQQYATEDAYEPSGSLDSSLKKHTTLLNRLRSALLSTPADALIKEIDGLALSKYIEEIVAAVAEGVVSAKGAKADVESAVEVIVHLHARLTPHFLPSLLPSLLQLLRTCSAPLATTDDKEKEEKDRLAKARTVLRTVGELALVGAWNGETSGRAKAKSADKDQDFGASRVLEAIKELTTNDPQYSNTTLLITFLKGYKRPYLGNLSGAGGALEEADSTSEADELVIPEGRKLFREEFERYFKAAGKALVKGHTRLLEQDKRNQEAYIKGGEIFEDRQHAYERMTRAVEKLQIGVQSLADQLNLKAPALPTMNSLSKTGLTIVEGGSVFTKGEDGILLGGIWDDEEEKRFYEDVLDLAEDVPGAVLGLNMDGSKQKVELDIASPEVKAEAALSDAGSIHSGAMSENGDAADLADGPTVGEKESIVPEEIQSGPAARLNAIFAAMPEANSKSMIDKLAVDFAFLNSKAARKRCYKFLGAVPKQRVDLLPYYARFAAILNRYMPDLGVGLIAIIDEELKYLQRKRLVKELESVRIKNVRFLGELAKFKVAQTHTVLHAFKVFLDDFTGPNVDNTALLLETCGRFLLRSDDTKEPAQAMVDIMRRKQASQHLDARQVVILENAFYTANPPERETREQVELDPMHAFIQYLLHDVLAKNTVDKVLRLLRKLHWEDEEVYAYIYRSFTEIWQIRFGNIPLIAMLVYDLQKYHAEFSLSIVDQALEYIRAGMEDNIFKYNQRRISMMKYLGELYMYRIVATPVVFDTLWSLISFGHAQGLPIPGRSSPIDTPNDFFRIRLVCTLLDTCGACFDKGSSKKKLDHFLTVFQLYVLCKDPLPMDVDFMLSDTLETLRPNMSPFKTFQSAAEAIDLLLAAQAQGGDGYESTEASDDEGARGGKSDDEDEGEVVDNDADARRIDDDEDQQVVLLGDIGKRDERDEEAEEEFNRDFAKMLADTTEVRKQERKTAPPVFDTAVPLIKRAKDEGKSASSTHMQFSLLQKRGTKQQVRTLEIPIASSIASTSMSHMSQNKQEQEQLKRLVLQNERRQEATEKELLLQDMRQRGIRTRVANG